MNNKDNIESMLEYAIIEHGAKEHLREYEQRRVRSSHPWGKYISYAAAACIILAVCTTTYLGYDAQKVGYDYELPAGIRGSSEISALMELKENKAAIAKIEETREWIKEEKKKPMFDNPDYINSLNLQEQELDFLEAVCLLRSWRFFSGKKALQKIAESGSDYASEAAKMIDRL